MTWVKGQSGNPAGRPKGARHKLGESYVNDLAKHYAENGVKAIKEVFKDDKRAYLKLVADLVPKEVELSGGDEPVRIDVEGNTREVARRLISAMSCIGLAGVLEDALDAKDGQKAQPKSRKKVGQGRKQPAPKVRRRGKGDQDS